jgi:hypothetical protein
LVQNGEAGSANQEGIELSRSSLRKLLKESEDEADDVYNQDESGAFWQQMPVPTSKRAGHKKVKERVTFCVHQCLRLTKDGAVCDWQNCAPLQLSQELSAQACSLRALCTQQDSIDDGR